MISNEKASSLNRVQKKNVSDCNFSSAFLFAELRGLISILESTLISYTSRIKKIGF